METRGEAAAGVQDRRLLGDLLEKGFSPAGGDRNNFGFFLKLLASSLLTWWQQDQTLPDIPVWQIQRIQPSAGRARPHWTPRYGRSRAFLQYPTHWDKRHFILVLPTCLGHPFSCSFYSSVPSSSWSCSSVQDQF